MNEFFTVDRNSQIKLGMKLDVNSNYDNRNFWPIVDCFNKNDLSNLVNEVYPNGLSEHGKRYLLDECLVISMPNGEPAPFVPNIPMVELVFELVRRLEFPHQISRFQAIFGWESLAEAKEFKRTHGKENSSIYVVKCGESAKLDMNLLYLGGSTIGSLFYARKYWRGEAGNHPRWEILMKTPVDVVRIIE